MAFKKLLKSTKQPKEPQKPRNTKPSQKDILNSFYQEYTKMSESDFDANNFLDAAVSEPSIRRPPIPAGTELVGIIGEPKVSKGQQKADPLKTWTRVDVPITFDLTQRPDIQAQLGGIDKVTLIDGVMLDITPAGTINNAPGSNSKMRRYREALNLNSAGTNFTWRMCQGRMIKCKIKHEVYEGEALDKIDAVSAAG